MSYCQGQVDYFGKKVISLLVMMEVRWKVDGKIIGFEYSFVDYVIKGYSGQDHVQVASVIQLSVDTVQERHPEAKKIIIQTDNAIDFFHKLINNFHFQYEQYTP